LQQETAAGGLHRHHWAALTGANGPAVAFLNPESQQVSTSMRMLARGGMICSDMGLGKTVMALVRRERWFHCLQMFLCCLLLFLCCLLLLLCCLLLFAISNSGFEFAIITDAIFRFCFILPVLQQWLGLNAFLQFCPMHLDICVF
jgi:hypothetical protein